MPQVILTDTEMMLAKHCALGRYNNARRRGIPNAKMGDQSNQATDENGMAAEIAACRIFNCYPDLTFPEHTSKIDLTYRGIRIDVKSTTLEHGRLIATLKTQVSDVDVYVLVTGTAPTLDVVGWARAKDLINEECIKDLGHGPGYCLTQSRLRDLRELLDYDGVKKPPEKHEPGDRPTFNFQEVYDALG